MIIFSLPAKVPLFLVKNKQTRFFLLISSFYSNIYCIFALTNALVAKLVDALDLGSSGSGRVGSSPIRRTEENPNCLIISSWDFSFSIFGNILATYFNANL